MPLSALYSLAHMYPYRRFACRLAATHARLGERCRVASPFTAADFHPLSKHQLAWRTPHPAHRCPSPDGMQRSPQRGSCLGQPVQHVRRASNPTKWLLAPRGTHQSTPPATCTDKVGVLPITGGYVVRPAPAVLRPPPPPFRLAVHFPALTGYRTPRSDALSQGAGPGRASPVPVATFRTFHVPYAGRFLEAAFQDLHLVHGLRPDHPGSAPPWSCQ